QTTHTVAPATIAGEFQKIVQAGATEYMLVNVSELRDYVMGARMIADITWNAPAVYGSPDPAGRYLSWWTREYFAPAAAQARAAYDAYHTLLDTPDKLWYASEAVQNLIERLWHRASSSRPTLLGRNTRRSTAGTARRGSGPGCSATTRTGRTSSCGHSSAATAAPGSSRCPRSAGRRWRRDRSRARPDAHARSRGGRRLRAGVSHAPPAVGGDVDGGAAARRATQHASRSGLIRQHAAPADPHVGR